MSLILYRSDDGRVKSGPYKRYGMSLFSLAESTAEGMLITEFESCGQVANQTYSKGGGGAEAALKEYLGVADAYVVESGRYGGVVSSSACSACGKAGLGRELDLKAPSEIHGVPVAPIFVCAACGARHYSMTDRYLKSLVLAGREMFVGEELAEVDSDVDASVASMQEYIIRIFASKKISRMR